MPRLTGLAGWERRSIWESLSRAPARLILSPSASPCQPSRSASAMRAIRLSWISAIRGRWAGEGQCLYCCLTHVSCGAAVVVCAGVAHGGGKREPRRHYPATRDHVRLGVRSQGAKHRGVRRRGP
jgi:hypothetical protein